MGWQVTMKATLVHSEEFHPVTSTARPLLRREQPGTRFIPSLLVAIAVVLVMPARGAATG